MESLIERIRARVTAGPACDHPGEWLPVQPPIGLALIANAETQLGFTLPTLLWQLYTEVGNGGFGPVFGLLPVSRASLGDSPPTEAEFDLVGQYQWLCGDGAEQAAEAGWRPGMVPVFYCGCTMFEFVDCLAEGGPVVPCDLGTDEMDAESPIESLATRLEEWLAGRYPW